MKFPKSVALLLIVGLMISSCSFGSSYPLSESPSQKPVTNDQPSSRDSLTGLSGGEQNIDPFTVHPINRWDSSSSGPLTTGIESGELSLETYLNDSTDSYYFRESSTADDTISIRWRLNQTADGEFTDLDFAGYGSMLGRAMNDKDYGTDGWGWAEAAAETDQNTYTDGTVSYLGGAIRVVSAFGVDDGLEWGASFRYLAFSFNTTINGTKYTSFEIRTKVEKIAGGANLDEEVFIAWWDASNNKVWESATNVTNAYQTFTHTAAVNWTGNEDAILVFLKTADGNQDDWTSGALEVAQWSIDYLRLSNPVNADEIQGDFAVPLCGLNATTSEGTANTTLTAFQFNSTHYIIRPSFTTGDGTYSRSWNMDSDYQEYYQLSGNRGSDGVDFTEGTDVAFGYQSGTKTAINGYLQIDPDASATAFYIFTVVDPSLSDSDDRENIWDYFTLKIRSNYSYPIYLEFMAANSLIDDASTWNTEVNLTQDWHVSEKRGSSAVWHDSARSFSSFGFGCKRVNAGDPDFDGYVFDVDYWRLSTTNDTSDFTFFEFNRYYRAELDYDLRSSQLEFELQDDLGDDIVKEEIGDFTIANFFDAQDLIPDIFIAEVGQIDYLLGLRTAGSNGTTWWDYYQAEFAEFTWRESSSSVGPMGPWEGIGPYACHIIYDSGDPGFTEIRYELVVPEFDSASGRVVIDELNLTNLVMGQFMLYFYSVDALTGTRHEESRMAIYQANVADVNPYLVLLYYNTSGTLTSVGPMEVNNGKDGWAEITFCIHYDKQNNFLSFQISGKDDAGTERRISASWPIIGDSNEIILESYFHASTATGGTGAEFIITLEDWSLTFRDIFGIPIDLPSIDDVIGGIFGFLGNIFAGIMAPVGLGLNMLADLLKPLAGILQQLGVLDIIKTAINTLQDALDEMVSGFGDVVDAAMGIISDAIDAFTDAIGLLAAQIWEVITDGLTILLDAVVLILGDITDAGVNFIRGIGVGGTTIGDVLDIIGTWLDFFVTTVADTIQFTLMIMVVWGTMLMVFIFIGIIFFAILGSDHAGQVPGKIWNAYSTNIMPFSIWGFRIHIPLAALVIPFIFVVIIGVV